MRAVACVAILALTWVSLAFAAEQVTVVSIDGGKAWHRAQDSTWKELKVGQKLAVGSAIRTEAKAVVRLLADDTSMLRISSVAPQVIRPVGADLGSSSTQHGLMTVLGEFLHSRGRETIAATRGVPGQDPEAAHYQVEWESLMGPGGSGTEAIPRFMDAAAYYEKLQRPDRAAALLRRLAAENSGNAAFASLAAQALTAYGSPAGFHVVIHRGNEQLPSRSAEMLKPNDEIHVQYTSPFESVLHVYLYSAPAAGPGSLARLYPPPGMASQSIGPNVALNLPAPGFRYSMTSMEDHEYLWGWSCAAAVQGASEEDASRRVQSTIAGSGKLTPDVLASAAPPQCLQGFAYSFSRAPRP